MKKRIVFLSLILVVFLSSCSGAFQPEKKEYQEITIINNTNQHVRYSIINGSTSATNSSTFYSQSHSYLVDWVGTTMFKQLLSPSGTQSGGYSLDRMTYKFNKSNYNATIFVCQSNTYSNTADVYINKKTFNFSGNTTITIASNRTIY